MSKDQILEELKVDLSEAQAKKLVKGQAVQLKPAMIGKGIPLKLDRKKARKLQRAMANNRGVRLMMTPEEIDGSGLWDWIKKAVRVVNKVIPLRGIAKAAAKTVLPAVATVVGGPAAGAATMGVVEKYGDKVIDVAADAAGLGMVVETKKGKGLRQGKGLGRGVKRVKSEGGALVQNYGMKGGAMKKQVMPRRYTVSDSSSFFMAPTSSAMNPPAASVPDMSYRIPLYSGNGLLPAGYKR